MQLIYGRLILSANDPTGFLECPQRFDALVSKRQIATRMY
jgi:hypothetical protein